MCWVTRLSVQGAGKPEARSNHLRSLRNGKSSKQNQNIEGAPGAKRQKHRREYYLLQEVAWN